TSDTNNPPTSRNRAWRRPGLPATARSGGPDRPTTTPALSSRLPWRRFIHRHRGHAGGKSCQGLSSPALPEGARCRIHSPASADRWGLLSGGSCPVLTLPEFVQPLPTLARGVLNETHLSDIRASALRPAPAPQPEDRPQPQPPRQAGPLDRPEAPRHQRA